MQIYLLNQIIVLVEYQKVFRTGRKLDVELFWWFDPQGDFTKDKTTTVTVGVSNVNTQISFGKNNSR
jgi:hypothetical protein